MRSELPGEASIRFKTPSKVPYFAKCLGVFGALLVSLGTSSTALSHTGNDQPASLIAVPEPSFSSVATHRFVASHGRRAVLMGYPETGLEFLAYPLQIVSGYQIGFQSEGAVSETDGRALLSRVIATPESVTRIYTGPDYVVRETLFVPLDAPAAIVDYEVDSAHPLNIVIHFAPVLDLMWPAALGGQSASWSPSVPGYVLNEPTHRFSAVIGSAQIVAHDATVNSTLHVDGQLAFSIRPQHVAGSDTSAPAHARVWISQVPANQPDPAVVTRALDADKGRFTAAAQAHYQSLLQDSLHIRTPDQAVNDALAWAQVALDQSWVCNPDLGCGVVGGYGPSRPGRRPQYAWFFAGDGLIVTDALISTGAFARAREELEFVARYQDQKTGMVWHELAQSAKQLDWSTYPYMFVHVDISFDYLNTVARYVAASGDTDFAIKHWASIAAAYRYCQSLVRNDDHLPHIPADKSAGDEQHSPADDLGLSTAWVEATQSFATLARRFGHAELAGDALQASELTRSSIAKKYWDAKRRFWIGSHTANGEPIFSRGSGPGSAIVEHIFSPEQNEQLLDQIASSRFQTDWGTRGLGSDSTIYAPWSYATGSIFAVHSTQSAQMFWQMHRPQVAWSIFRGIVPWSTIDAPGHIHEVFAGNYFRPQTESVPEQTWSSAGLLGAAVHGLLGLDIDGTQNSLNLRPHIPAEWNEVSIDHIRLPHSMLDVTLHHDAHAVNLVVHNTGEPAAIAFEPEIPLGAEVVDAQCNDMKVATSVVSTGQDTHAQLKLTAASGTSECHLHLSGGVSIMLPAPTAQIGDTSTGMKLTRLSLHAQDLAMDIDAHAQGAHRFQLQTPWKIQSIRGATLKVLSNDLYEIQLPEHSKSQPANDYASTHVDVGFADP